jgi:hypothetical protein
LKRGKKGVSVVLKQYIQARGGLAPVTVITFPAIIPIIEAIVAVTITYP